jgi:hypothetical protein
MENKRLFDGLMRGILSGTACFVLFLGYNFFIEELFSMGEIICFSFGVVTGNFFIGYFTYND